jgi:NAD+ synthase
VDISKETTKTEVFIREYLLKSGCDGYVLGLSGGLDSALVLALACRAVGVDKVRTYAMPYGIGGTSIEMAKLAVEAFPVRHVYHPIDSDVDVLARGILYDEKNAALRKGNIMARVRMIKLYDNAARYNSLVLNTSNLSELALGYATKYGDSTGDIAPILHLTKTQIREMSAYVGVPQPIIDQKPSAGLVEGQTDEGDFGFTYEDVDKVIEGFMKNRVSKDVSTLYRWMQFALPNRFGVSNEAWDKIQRRNLTNHHKMVPIESLSPVSE